MLQNLTLFFYVTANIFRPVDAADFWHNNSYQQIAGSSTNIFTKRVDLLLRNLRWK